MTSSKLKLLSGVAALAMVAAVPTESFAFGRGGGWHRNGWWPGAVAAGAVVGGALAANAYYDGGYYPYYDDTYYDNGYYDDGAAVAVVPSVGGDASYCAQRFRSYDPASGTYLGYDGLRHPCP